MTAAMVREAARIVDEWDLLPAAIVSFTELGSEGALLKITAFERTADLSNPAAWMIARNGESRPWPR